MDVNASHQSQYSDRIDDEIQAEVGEEKHYTDEQEQYSYSYTYSSYE